MPELQLRLVLEQISVVSEYSYLALELDLKVSEYLYTQCLEPLSDLSQNINYLRHSYNLSKTRDDTYAKYA